MSKRPPVTLEQMKCDAKKAHASQRMAERSASARAAEIGRPLFTYRCPHCKRWHITKKANGAPRRPSGGMEAAR